MTTKTTHLAVASLLAIGVLCPTSSAAQQAAQVSVGMDFVSRYIWRGLNVGDAPSVQPAITLESGGFAVGAWGSYSLSNDITAGDEIDLWLGYTHEFSGGGSLGIVFTDYYFPNAGGAFSNYKNYDAVDGPGAHVLEIGATVTPSSFPVTLAAYANLYNDEGHNVYLEASYPFAVGDASLTLFAGATPGSTDNPGYYGADQFKFLSVGIKAEKDLPLSERFSLPISATWSVNPNLDIAYLVVGFSL